jgi:hypothetical protein
LTPTKFRPFTLLILDFDAPVAPHQCKCVHDVWHSFGIQEDEALAGAWTWTQALAFDFALAGRSTRYLIGFTFPEASPESFRDSHHTRQK